MRTGYLIAVVCICGAAPLPLRAQSPVGAPGAASSSGKFYSPAEISQTAGQPATTSSGMAVPGNAASNAGVLNLPSAAGSLKSTAAGSSSAPAQHPPAIDLPKIKVHESQPGGLNGSILEVWQLLDYRVPLLGIELFRLLQCLVILLLALALGRLTRVSLTKAAQKLEERNRELACVTLRALARSVYLIVLTQGLSAAVYSLALRDTVKDKSLTLVAGLTSATVGYILWCLVDVVTYWLSRLSARTSSRLDDMLIPLVTKCLRVAVVVLVLAQVADTLGQPVASILAGLGIGGLAIGLAAQDTIKNLFGSVMIFGDRPFEMGDRIVVDGYDGPVEMVGFRSTRIRTSEGHLVTIPNGELASKTILNIGKPPFLKQSLTLKLSHDTSPEQVQQAVQILKDILHDHEGQPARRPPSVSFAEITEKSLNLVIGYWYSPPDAARFAALNERVNFEILRRFHQAGIRLATASPVVHLAAEALPRLAHTPPAKPDTQAAATGLPAPRSAVAMQDIRPRRVGA